MTLLNIHKIFLKYRAIKELYKPKVNHFSLIKQVVSTLNPTSFNHPHRPQLCSGTILGICRLFS